jgi:hypothetical protein
MRRPRHPRSCRAIGKKKNNNKIKNKGFSETCYLLRLHGFISQTRLMLTVVGKSNLIYVEVLRRIYESKMKKIIRNVEK